jgi:glutaredoxin
MSVIVYSKKNCPACERAKALLTKNGVEFEVKNIDTDLDAMDFVVSKKHRAMPVVYKDGTQVLNIETLE